MTRTRKFNKKRAYKKRKATRKHRKSRKYHGGACVTKPISELPDDLKKGFFSSPTGKFIKFNTGLSGEISSVNYQGKKIRISLAPLDGNFCGRESIIQISYDDETKIISPEANTYTLQSMIKKREGDTLGRVTCIPEVC